MSPLDRGVPAGRRGIAYEITTARDGFDGRFERRDSTQASCDHVYSAHDRQHGSRVPHAIEPRPRAGGNDDYEASRYGQHAELPTYERQPEAHFTPYQNNQPSFFMPSQYDYRQGRARKRSNLPKQSTEIMKTWFDQVRQPL